MQEAVIAEKDSNGLYQGGLGAGTTNMPNWDQWGYYPVVPTSAGIELGDGCGETTFNVLKEDGSLHYAAKVPVFFGLKHPFGHIWKIVRGLIDNVGDEKSEVYVAPSLYAGYDDNSISGLIKVCEVPRTGGYIKQKSYYLLCAMPTEIGATASTYFCDYFWENSASSKGLRVRLSGASATDGTSAGGVCYEYVQCGLVFGCGCVRSPLLFRCGSGDVGLKRKRKTERGKERSLKFCIESFGKAVRRVSELAVRRVDFCDFFAGFG